MKNRIPITLMAQDRARLGILASTWDVSLAEAVRRAILAEYERIQEDVVRPGIEGPLRVKLEGLESRLAELEPQIGGTALRLLALINCSKSRAEVEAEIARMVAP